MVIHNAVKFLLYSANLAPPSGNFIHLTCFDVNSATISSLFTFVSCLFTFSQLFVYFKSTVCLLYISYLFTFILKAHMLPPSGDKRY